MEKLEKKLTENIYVVSLLIGRLLDRGVNTFLVAEKIISKTTENVLKPYENVKYAKISEKMNTEKILHQTFTLLLTLISKV